MKHLWSPWRMTYIEGGAEDVGCLFCQCLAGPDGPENLVLHRGTSAYVILNRFPYTNGHMMVVPFAHQASLESLDPNVLAELMHLTTQALRVLRQVYGAEGFNIGANIGVPAGAGIADHVHLHVVPRWSGDTNFMTTTAETRVVPSMPETTYQRLLEGWRAINTAS
jgi:ATP adenylyltransferase